MAPTKYVVVSDGQSIHSVAFTSSLYVSRGHNSHVDVSLAQYVPGEHGTVK